MNGKGDAKVWSVDQVMRMLKKGTITYSNIYQRSYVWDKERECNLFASLVEGYDIPAITCNRHTMTEDGMALKDATYDLLNGKQRLTAMEKIFNGEVKMEGLRPLKLVSDDAITFTDEEKELLHYRLEDGREVIDINGLTFLQLPELLQRATTVQRKLRFDYYENMTREEERQTIINANSGKGMTTAERMRVETVSFVSIMQLAAHPVFKISLTEKSIQGYWNEKIVEQIYAMLYMTEPCLDVRVFRPFIVNATFTDEQVTEIQKILDTFQTIYEYELPRNGKIAKQRILGKIHMVSMAPFVGRALKDNVPLERLADWMEYFFSGSRRASISEKYNEYTSRNTAQRRAVEARNTEIELSYDKYIVNGEEIPEIEKPVKKTAKKKEEDKPVVRTMMTEEKLEEMKNAAAQPQPTVYGDGFAEVDTDIAMPVEPNDDL